MLRDAREREELLQLMHRNNTLPSWRVQGLTNIIHQRPSNQISRCRIDSNLRDHDTPGFFGASFVFLDHRGHIRDFACDIEVVRSICSAGFEGVFAVESVRSNSGDEDCGFLGESG